MHLGEGWEGWPLFIIGFSSISPRPPPPSVLILFPSLLYLFLFPFLPLFPSFPPSFLPFLLLTYLATSTDSDSTCRHSDRLSPSLATSTGTRRRPNCQACRCRRRASPALTRTKTEGRGTRKAAGTGWALGSRSGMAVSRPPGGASRSRRVSLRGRRPPWRPAPSETGRKKLCVMLARADTFFWSVLMPIFNENCLEEKL